MWCFWRGCRLARFGVAVIGLLAWAAEAQGQTERAILHEALQCIQQDRFPVVDAAIEPGAELRTAKVYFRSEQFPDFYYVEMGVVGNRFVGVLPKPAPETKRVFYYIEAVDFAFNGSRNEEHDSEVREGCKRRDGAAYVPGDDPGIMVGATKPGASAVPPGFQAAGIAGFITAAGVTSGVGGGVGVGTAIVVGAAAAGGVAGAVVVTNNEGGEGPTTTVPIGGPAPTTTSISAGGGTTTVGPTTTSSVPSGPTTTTTPGGTTTTTPVPSTTTVPGGTTTTTTVSTTTTTTGSSTTMTSSTTTTTAPEAVSACFTAQLVPSCGCSNDCKVRFDASCSAGPVTRYDWVLDTGDAHRTVVTSTSGPVLVYDWGPGEDCEGEIILTNDVLLDHLRPMTDQVLAQR